jgi:hypothetical protein
VRHQGQEPIDVRILQSSVSSRRHSSI